MRRVLADGPKPAREVLDGAAALGIAEKTLRRAAGRLGVVIARRHEPGKRGSAGGTWRLVSGSDSDADSGGQVLVYETCPPESAPESPTPPDATRCPVCAGPLTERGVCWDCNDRPCAACGAATGAALPRYCSSACQQRG